VTTVTWEESARTKKSSWGPCISDMTLTVNNRALPIIRYPNYEDLTWDVPMTKIPLVVGNELEKKGGKMYTITLKEYLEQFRMYLHKPSDWIGSQVSLYSGEKDSHVLMSAQSCFLPVPKGQDAVFNIAIHNYQSSARNPAVLAIVATTEGTSAQIVECDSFSGVQKLYFNKAGERASFVGVRLSDDRKERGVAVQGAMTQDEKQKNMIMVIQVPLKHVSKVNDCYDPAVECWDDSDGDCEECEEKGGGGMYNDYSSVAVSSSGKSAKRRVNVQRKREKADVEEAIVKVGDVEGKYTEVGGLSIERDCRYPVRVTLQFYKTTANGVVDDAAVGAIAKQLTAARSNADSVGSLVVGNETSRPTNTTSPSITVAPWWTSFWLTYGSSIPMTQEEAIQKVFAGGRFVNSSLSAYVRDQVLSLLQNSVPRHNTPVIPTWDVLYED